MTQSAVEPQQQPIPTRNIDWVTYSRLSSNLISGYKAAKAREDANARLCARVLINGEVETAIGFAQRAVEFRVAGDECLLTMGELRDRCIFPEVR